MELVFLIVIHLSTHSASIVPQTTTIPWDLYRTAGDLDIASGMSQTFNN